VCYPQCSDGGDHNNPCRSDGRHPRNRRLLDGYSLLP
jgi:hypothetical protein